MENITWPQAIVLVVLVIMIGLVMIAAIRNLR